MTDPSNMKPVRKIRITLLAMALAAAAATAICLPARQGLAYTASKVSFEARPNGIYRVYVTYTVPALKEVRESFVEFRSRRDAEQFYYDLLSGADFYHTDPARREFRQNPRQPVPW